MISIRKNLSLIVVTAFLIVVPAIGFSQTTPEDPGGDPDVPVDGGLSILLAAGVGYVAKKGYDKRKKTVADYKQGL